MVRTGDEKRRAVGLRREEGGEGREEDLSEDGCRYMEAYAIVHRPPIQLGIR